MSWPQPTVGTAGIVQVNGQPLNIVAGTWQVQEAERFGDKQSTGALRYADFNPYESAHAVASFLGGYGLRRYSDVDNPDAFIDWYDDVENMDFREGIGVMGPEIVTESPPTVGTSIIWLGEFTPSTGALAGLTKLVAIADTKVWYRNVNGTWTDTGIALGAAAVGNAIGVFGGNLVIGYGSGAVAQYTTDLATLGNVVNATPANIYVFAFTADRANTYVAGGPLVTDTFKVTSSATGINAYSTTPVICGASDAPIKSLAPGGGLVLVYVGKTKELGQIDASSVYHVLIPFDSYLTANCQILQWYQGTPSDQQRGPLALVFNRDRSLWEYQPNTQTAGDASNVSPWALRGIRPSRIKGIPQCAQGTAGWLYWVPHGTTASWLVARDADTGRHHPIATLNLSTYDLVVSTLFGGNPRLFFTQDKQVSYIVLPLDGESTLDDTNCRFVTTGYVTIPDIDLGFPDEAKIAFEVRVVADNLSAGIREIAVAASLDGGAYSTLGTVSTSPSGSVSFPTSTSAKRVKLKFTFTNTDPTQTPQFLGFSLRVSLNAKLYRIWSFQAHVPSGTMPTGAQDTQNPYTVVTNTWTARVTGFPITFIDRWGDTYNVRILKMAEAEVRRENTHAFETALEFQLLEVGTGAGNLAYDNNLSKYDAVTSRYG